MPIPYISQIFVGDCYASKNFHIPSTPLEELKHIILTGKNGTGKTTILNRLSKDLRGYEGYQSKQHYINALKTTKAQNPRHTSNSEWDSLLAELESQEIKFISTLPDNFFVTNSKDYILTFFNASRQVHLQEVVSVSKESDFRDQTKINSDLFGSFFKQYLVNKKVYEAFDFMNSKFESAAQNAEFFERFTETLRRLMEDPKLELQFVQETFEFYLSLSDGRKVTFNQLSAGFSAFISIIMDLFMRTDLMRKEKSNYAYDPEGVVLIDEPENHLHLSLQYEVLPLLTSLFPKIQFIVATHSPAIISSIKNAVVFDLGSKKEIFEKQAGSSYSELMIKHFGLENEFSPVADKILLEVTQAVDEGNDKRLQEIIYENENYLTPSLRFEIENQIFAIQAKIEK